MADEFDKIYNAQEFDNFDSDLPKQEKITSYILDPSNPQAPNKSSLTSQKFLSNLLSCNNCHSAYNNQEFLPKVLICGHTICNTCLLSLSSSLIICPFCQHADKRNLTKIPENIYLKQLIEDNDHKNYCEEHSKEIGIYCENDRKFLCFDCVITHKGHDFLPLTDKKLFEMADINRKFIQDAKNECKNKIENGESVISTIEEEDIKIGKLVENHIQSYNEVKNDLIVAIMKATSCCTGKIESYLDIRIKNQKDLTSLKTFIENSSENLKDIEMIEKEYENKTIVDKLGWSRDEIEKIPEIPSIEPNCEIIEELEKFRNHKFDVFEVFKRLINDI